MIFRMTLLVALAAAVSACSDSTDSDKPADRRVFNMKPTDKSRCSGEAPARLEGSWELDLATSDNSVTAKQVLNFRFDQMTMQTVCKNAEKSVGVVARAPIVVNVNDFEIRGTDTKVEMLADVPCAAEMRPFRVSYAFQGSCLKLDLGQGPFLLAPSNIRIIEPVSP